VIAFEEQGRGSGGGDEPCAGQTLMQLEQALPARTILEKEQLNSMVEGDAVIDFPGPGDSQRR